MIPFSFPILVPPLMVLWASYYTHLQYYQRCEPMIFRMRVKSSFFSENYAIITYWLKEGWKIQIFEALFFWKRTVTANLKKFSLNTIFRWYTSNWIILEEDLIRQKRCFGIFLIDHCADY